MRWSALHACVIGWAEYRSSKQILKNKIGRVLWNGGDNINLSDKNKNKNKFVRISEAACTALRPSGTYKDVSVSTDDEDTKRTGTGLVPRHAEVMTLLLKVRTVLKQRKAKAKTITKNQRKQEE